MSNRFWTRRISMACTLALTAGPLMSGGASALPSAPVAAHGSAEASLDGLRILLTNDDSVGGTQTRGIGLWELRKALCNDGADVIVVGPATGQSGMGTRLTIGGTLSATPATPQAAYKADCQNAPSAGAATAVNTTTQVGASPVDTVWLALGAADVLPAGWRPDLVMSGTNFGQNIGISVNHSGTVAATIAAIEHGVPAIAMSAQIACTPNAAGAFACVDFEGAAEFAADLVARLRSSARPSGALLPSGVALNVNYPADCSEPSKLCTETFGAGSPVVTATGTRDESKMVYSGSNGTYTAGITICPIADCPETVKDADTIALADHHVTISPITADRTASSAVVNSIGSRLRY